jgi:hypothetical protein
MHLFYEKSKILTSLPQNLIICHTKNLCHHIEHTLFYLWLKYGKFWINIVNPIESFFNKTTQWDIVPKPSFKTIKDMF